MLCGDPNTCDCLYKASSAADVSACPHDFPPPSTTATCSTDGRQYLYKKCLADPNDCNSLVCHWGYSSLKAGETAPANWPCPVQ